MDASWPKIEHGMPVRLKTGAAKGTIADPGDWATAIRLSCGGEIILSFDTLAAEWEPDTSVVPDAPPWATVGRKVRMTAAGKTVGFDGPSPATITNLTRHGAMLDSIRYWPWALLNSAWEPDEPAAAASLEQVKGAILHELRSSGQLGLYLSELVERISSPHVEAAVAALRDEGRVIWGTGRITISACQRALDKALRRADARLQGSTIRDSESHLVAHILPALGAIPVEQVDVPRLRAFVRDLRAKMAPYTARNVHATLTLLLDAAMGEGWAPIQANPARLKAVRDELPEARPRAGRSGKLRVTLAAAQRLIDAASTPDERRVRYVVDLTSACRNGELSGAQVDDVAPDAPVPFMKIERALQLKPLKGHAKLGKTKTEDSRRVVPLHPAAVAALRWWLAEGWEIHVGRPPVAGDPLFPNKRGRSWRPRSAEFFRADLKAAGLPEAVDGHPLTFHAARRSCAHALQSCGVPEDARQRLLGHAPRTAIGKHYEESDLGLLAEYVGRIHLTWPGPGGISNAASDVRIAG